MDNSNNRWPVSTPEKEQDDSEEVNLEHGTNSNSKNASMAMHRDSAGSTELNAIIGAGTHFQGTLSFAGAIRIDGEFSGRALGGETLVVGEGAKVSGELRAARIIILGGRVDAEITATASIELFIPATVSGDLRCPHIYMDRGIEFQGTCDMTGQELDE